MWAAGSVRGLRARGGYEVDLKWAGGALTEALLVVRQGGPVRVKSAALAAGAAVTDAESGASVTNQADATFGRRHRHVFGRGGTPVPDHAGRPLGAFTPTRNYKLVLRIPTKSAPVKNFKDFGRRRMFLKTVGTIARCSLLVLPVAAVDRGQLR